MKYTVASNEDKQYVSVTFTGLMTKEEHDNSRDDIIGILAKHGWKRLLVDNRHNNAKMSVFEDFEFTQGHQKTLVKYIRMAIIHRVDETERYTFIENVAMNRGVTIKVFTDPEAAIGWLVTK